jgi:hypothetical protein
MRTQKRLTEAYENARTIPFDDESKFFISDCHRGDGSLSDEFMRNENSYLHAFNSHHDTFRAIERFFDDGRYVLIWGNHNNFLREKSYIEDNLNVHRNEYTGEVPYFNAGCCVFPTMLTAIELSRGELRLVLWRVVLDADGHLKVERRVIGGPEPVARFAMD